MTMVEKIAKALHDDLACEAASQDGHKRYWETAPIQVKMLCRRQARVALKAAKIPTPAMLDEDVIQVVVGCCSMKPKDAEEVWGQMIEAALSEKDT